MLTKKTLIVLLLISFSILNAQKLELGKVTIEELQQKTHPKDSSAVAAILFKKGKVTFDYSQDSGFDMSTEVLVKIKVYKKEGYEWANKGVRYFIGNVQKESVLFSEAVTYNLVDGKIVKTKLKSDGEFDEKINKYWGMKKISMPNVKEGSILEYRYVLRSPGIGALKEWDFQTSIPVNYSEFKTYIPEYFTYNTNQKGSIFPKVTVEKFPKSINYTYREASAPGELLAHSSSQEKLEFIETKTTYIAENLPAMKEEAFVNNIDNYTSSLSNELSMVSYPNSPLKSYSTDWESVTKTIYDYDGFGTELNKTGYFEDDINALIKDITSPEERIAKIFNYVKSKVKWNDYYDYTCDEGVKKAYKQGTGNVAEINLMLTAMLRHAGLTANPVLVSTRSNGIAFFPNRNAYNYVIAAVEIENDLILLDATEKYSVPNVLPLRDLNWFGRLIRKNGSSTQVDLTPKTFSKEVTNMAFVINPDGSIAGKLRSQATDHSALLFRQKNSILTNDSYLEKLENENNNIDISDYVRENNLDCGKPIIETFTFKDTKDVEIIGGKMYISPLLFLNYKENPFKQEKREYPVDFGYPTQDRYNIAIDIPEGYQVETMPAPLNLGTTDNISAFKYNIANIGNKIQVTITADINAAIVPTDYYVILKDFFQKMIDKQNEKIVLKKI
jgi:Transglutaminase-like superfamily/Domain of Unknown Function with PDB structure (DUF3857)